MAAVTDVRHISSERDGLFVSMKRLVEFRHLIATVARRELRLRYKQTALGIAWALVHPLALMAVMTMVFSRVVKLDSEGVPYYLFAYAALLPWTFVATATSLSMMSLVKDVELVTRVWFPREILPLGSVIASLFDFSIAFLMFVVLLVLAGRPPGAVALFVVPMIGIQAMLVVGLALFNSALNVRYRDVKFIVPLGLQLWMFLSPVIYSISEVPDHLRTVFALNPVVGLVEGYRASVLHHRLPDMELVGISACISFAIMLTGLWYFRRVEGLFADVI